MLVFLLLMLSIQQAQTCKGNPINRRTDLEDCTRTFRNRTASFESGLYPGYWMYPQTQIGEPYIPCIYSTSIANVKEDKTYHWYLHDCGSGKVCLEPKSEGWENYYIQYQKVPTRTYITHDTNFYDGSNESKEMEIWCTSCAPEGDNLTYSDCQIVKSKVDPEMSLTPSASSNTAQFAETRYVKGSSRFKWRILSPQTRQYWETTVAADNCGGQVDLRPSHTVTSSITRTESTTQTTTVSAKISLGKEAAEALKLLGVETGISHSWSTTSTTEAAEGQSTTLGGSLGHVVKPGYKWIVKQLVGEAGYTKIKSLHFTSDDVKCT